MYVPEYATGDIAELQQALSHQKVRSSQADLFARLRHPVATPVATWRMFSVHGGMGCSNKTLWTIWRDIVFGLVGLMAALLLFEPLRALNDMLSLGTAPVISWFLGTGQTLFTLFLLVFMPIQIMTGLALLYGTVLRGLGRQPVTGGTNLPDTGRSNIVLRFMGHKG